MRILNLIKYLVLFVFFTSCNIQSERREKEYFDLEGLIAQQIQQLGARELEIRKRAWINGVFEEEKTSLDSGAWAAELNIFKEADINKPRLFGLYQKNESWEGNDRTLLYTAKEPEKLPIEFLKIVFKDDQLKSVEALFSDENILYTTHRNMYMGFRKDNEGTLLLSEYQLKGMQKMILKDSLVYRVASEILF